MRVSRWLYTIEIIILVLVAIFLCRREEYVHSFSKEELTICDYHGFFRYVSMDEAESVLSVSANSDIAPLLEDEALRTEKIAYFDLSIPFGMYSLNVEYESDFLGEDLAGKQQVYIEAFASNHEEKFGPETLFLKKNMTETKTLFWLPPRANIDEYGFSIFLNSVEGETIIRSIELKEYSLWKVGFLMLLLFWVVIFNICIFKICKLSSNQKLVFFWLILLIVYSSLPAINSEFYGGHDVEFHMSRIKSMANELTYGNFPVRYQHDAYDGFGNIVHTMYPNLFLYIPVFLHIFGMPLDISYNIYVVLINILTCILCYYSFIKLFYRKRYALLGTTVYMLAAYRICNLYVRFAVGEYTAMAFMPLLIYGLIGLYYSNGDKRLINCLPLIIGVSGMIQSHVLSCEIMAGFLVLWALLHFKKSINLIKPLLISIVLTLGINSFFLFPFFEMYSTDLLIKGGNPKSPVGHGVYPTQILGMFSTYKGGSIANSAQGEMPLVLGAGILLGGILFVICFIKRNDWQLKEESNFKVCSVLFGFGLLSTWISSEFFPWSYLDDCSNFFAQLFVAIEFPWRYIAFSTLFFSFSLLYSVTILEKKVLQSNQGELLQIVILLVSFIVIGDFYKEYVNHYPTESLDYVITDCATDNMYNLKDFVEADIQDFTKEMVESHNEVVFHDIEYVYDKKYYDLENSGREVLISFPMQAYKYVYARDVDTNKFFLTVADENGKLSVNIPAGYEGTVEIGFEEPVWWRITEIISLFCVIGTAVFMFYHYKYLRIDKMK